MAGDGQQHGPIRARGYALEPWQQDAVEAWVRGIGGRPFHGTLEIFTGGGKSLIAIACAERAAMVAEDVKLAIVVPTKPLVHQWVKTLARHTSLASDEVGTLGAGKRVHLADKRVLVCVLNSAAKYLPAMASEISAPLMLVVDECHRAGAPMFANVLEAAARFHVGLSATPDREEVDEDGNPIEYDEQVVGRRLGDVVFSFDLKAAREADWLPTYTVHHHGVLLTDGERVDYEALSREVDDAKKRLSDAGFSVDRAVGGAPPGDSDLRRLFDAFKGATNRRKDLLYRATLRHGVALRLVQEILARASPMPRRVLLFHERVEEATALAKDLSAVLREGSVALEHSRLPAKERRRALDAFREGTVQVLVSVRSLIEGIDVPEADVGISVAASSSVRQRIQSLGRVLRRPFDGSEKTAEMHMIYVSDTVDEEIYAKEDWSELLGGTEHDRYFRWGANLDEGPAQAAGPPRQPRPTEEQEHERLSRLASGVFPTQWLGVPRGQEYSVDTLGTVRTRVAETVIGNPQSAADMVLAIRDRPGGRFLVTRRYRYVLVASGDQSGFWVAGRLDEPFRSFSDSGEPADEGAGLPGLRGPLDKENGTYRISSRRGGTIQKEAGKGVILSALIERTGEPQREANARAVLARWRELGLGKGLEFHCNSEWEAYAWIEGGPVLLAEVPAGFAWPEEP